MTNKALFIKIIGMVCAIFAVLSLTSALAFGQLEQGTIAGAVRDATGAVVADANVIVKNIATGGERTIVTSSLGEYHVPGLSPATYQVTISKAGFKTYKQTVEVAVGGHSTVDAQLEIGSSSTVIEVTAAGAATEVNTQTQELSQLIDPKQMIQLPSLTRNPYDFVALSGNVSNADATSNGTGQMSGQETTLHGVGYSLNGQRNTGTEILLDGVENESIFSVLVGEDVPVDAVQEYSVITNNFTAEYGRASGGVVNVTTKSGTNNWHGSGWEFNRLSAYTANTYNNAVQTPVIPKGIYTRNQFGFVGGGPIIKNKLFVSGSNEWTRIRSDSPQIEEIFDPKFITGNAATGWPGLPANAQAYYNAFATNPAPTNGITINAGELAGAGLNVYMPGGLPTSTLANPATTVFDQTVFKVPYDAGGGLPGNSYDWVARADYNLSDKTLMFFRFGHERIFQQPGTAFFSAYPAYDVGSLSTNQMYLYSLNHQFTANVLDTAKVSYMRFNSVTNFNQSLTYIPNIMFVSPVDPFSTNTIASPGLENLNAPGLGGVPVGGPQNTIQFEDDLSWSKGRHNMKYGGQFTYIQLDYAYGAYNQAVEQLGSTQQQSLDDLVNAAGNPGGSQLAGNGGFTARVNPNGALPCPLDANNNPVSPCPSYSDVVPPLSPANAARSYRYKDWAIYGQDSFRLTPRLTLNYGLRWEHYGVQHNNHQNLDSNFYLGAGSSLEQQVANGQVFLTQKSPTGQFWAPSWGTFAPRVGFAYDVFGDGKTSLRGGFGLSYERNFGNVTYNASFNPPASAVLSQTCPPDTPTCNVLVTNNDAGPLGLSTTPPSNLGPVELRFIDNKIRTAQTQFWDLDLQREVARNTIVDLSYSGAHGVHLYDIDNVNQVGAPQVYLGAPLNIGNPLCSEFVSPTGACLTRPNQQFAAINDRGSFGSSSYNAFNLRFQTQDVRHTGVTVVANYTWAHSLDDISSTFSESLQGGSGYIGSLGYTDLTNPKLDWGPSDYDIRHRISVSPIWTTPWFKGGKGVGEALGGWSLSGIFTARTGIPFNVYDYDNIFVGYTVPRLTPATTPDYRVSSNPAPYPAAGHNAFGLLSVPVPASFAPLNSTLGISDFGPFPSNMTGRNSFRGPGAWNLDAAVQKNFKITERYGLEFRAEGFNIFNHHNMYVNTTNLYYAGPTATPIEVVGLKGGLNTISLSGNHDERRFGQFALRFTF